MALDNEPHSIGNNLMALDNEPHSISNGLMALDKWTQFNR